MQKKNHDGRIEMEQKVNGVVLSSRKHHESSRLVTILTADGVIGAFANGAENPKSALFAGTQPFCFGEFILTQSKGVYRVKSSDVQENFYHLRDNLSNLTLANYLCELAGEGAGNDSAEIMRLLLNCLYLMSSGKYTDTFIKPVFELRLACEAGYMPDLTACGGCGEQNGKMYFDFDGELRCGECKRASCAPLSAEILNAMRKICSQRLEKIFRLGLDDEQYMTLGRITEKYVLKVLDCRPATLDYYKQLR